MQETWVCSLDREDLLEKEMAMHSRDRNLRQLGAPFHYLYHPRLLLVIQGYLVFVV